MTVSRVLQIVRARGIDGVVLPVHQNFEECWLDAGWNDFATVGLNDLRLSERVDTVTADYYQNTEMAVRRVRQLGLRRIGLAVASEFDAASNGLAHGCFLRAQAEVARADRVPVCFLPRAADERAAALAEWIEEFEPAAVLCSDSTLDAERVGRPDVLWVQLQQASAAGGAAIDACAEEIAAVAIDCLVGKMRRFDKGGRASSRLHMIKGVWRESAVATELVASVA
jgi:hypothetical protein